MNTRSHQSMGKFLRHFFLVPGVILLHTPRTFAVVTTEHPSILNPPQPKHLSSERHEGWHFSTDIHAHFSQKQRGISLCSLGLRKTLRSWLSTTRASALNVKWAASVSPFTSWSRLFGSSRWEVCAWTSQREWFVFSALAKPNFPR